MATGKSWITEIVEYCGEYNIPAHYLVDTLYEPKVVPMIRGMAFEFSVMIALKKVLPKSRWKVEKVPMNAQRGLNDIDVLVTHKASGKKISVECKLAKKESFRTFSDGHIELRVKCMRSRTLGPAMVKLVAPKIRIPEKALAVHNDQYLPGDFDVLITSIGNAFYRTYEQTNKFEWNPSQTEIGFLKKLFTNKGAKKLQTLAFEKMYICLSKDVAISRRNGILCTRKGCDNKSNCGFIPNYPLIIFKRGSANPEKPWIDFSYAERIFRNLIK
jgi:hypothetical protein